MQSENTVVKIEGGRRVRGLARESKDGLPSISIITAVYNGNATIEAAVKSVINQNYPNVEYIVIDGGSADGTIDTLKKYNEFIDYWVSEPDRGVYDALNKGIDLAHGEWLYFLGADDTLADENVLQRIFSGPIKGKMIYGNVIWGKTGKIYDGEFSKRKLCYQNICQQAVFYHRDLFRLLGKFDTNYPLLADWVLNIRVFADRGANHPRFISDVIAVYSEEGMSTHRRDEVFALEHEKLVRNLFGVRLFLYLKVRQYFEDHIKHVFWLLRKVPIPLLTGKTRLGRCSICKLQTLFIELADKSDEKYLCIRCRSKSNTKL